MISLFLHKDSFLMTKKEKQTSKIWYALFKLEKIALVDFYCNTIKHENVLNVISKDNDEKKHSFWGLFLYHFIRCFWSSL